MAISSACNQPHPHLWEQQKMSDAFDYVPTDLPPQSHHHVDSSSRSVQCGLPWGPIVTFPLSPPADENKTQPEEDEK